MNSEGTAVQVPINAVLVQVESVANADTALVRFCDLPGVEDALAKFFQLVFRQSTYCADKSGGKPATLNVFLQLPFFDSVRGEVH